MRQVCTLVAMTAVALSARVPVARAASPDEPGRSEVTALSVVPASPAGRAEVVIAVDGTVDVQDFSLASPARVVLDLRGATLSMPPRLYDKVRRGGVTDVRAAQYKDDVVRVVISLDAEHQYTVTRGTNAVRVAIDGGTGSFAAWHAAAAASRAEPKPTGLPSSRMSPLVGRRRPDSTFISVDLPAPFSPRRA